jgi:hypothetical protein
VTSDDGSEDTRYKIICYTLLTKLTCTSQLAKIRGETYHANTTYEPENRCTFSLPSFPQGMRANV